MKQYIPNRTPLQIVERPKATKPAAPRRPSNARRIMLAGLLALTFVTTVISGVVIIRQQSLKSQEMIAEILDRDSRIAALTKENRNLTTRQQSADEHRLRQDAELRQLQSVVDRQRGELSQLGQDHEATRMSLLTTRQLLAAAESARQQLTVTREQLQNDLQRLAKLFIQSLQTLGDTVAGDPQLARDVWRDAISVATAQGLDHQPLSERVAALPARRAIPVGTTLVTSEIVHHQHETTANVIVQDANGRFIPGLSRADIEVYSGQRRLHAVAISETRQNAHRHDIALLLDTSGSTSGSAHDALKTSAMEFVKVLSNPSRIRVWQFADDVTALSPWTIDLELLQPAIFKLTPGGGTALYKALRVATNDLKERSGSRSIVLFTDGSDSFQQESVDATLELCRQQSIPVHVVALQTAETKEDVLRRIAAHTGGTYHMAVAPTQLAERFREVSKAFQQPVYRLHLYEPVDPDSLTLRVSDLPPVSLAGRR